MEEKHKELLELHRQKFHAVDVERLYPILQGADVLTSDEVKEVNSQNSKIAKVEKFLDILPQKGSLAFESLCLALETCYPHLLTVMFLGSSRATSDSRSTSLTSDSEDDMRLRPLVADTRSQEFRMSSLGTVRKVIPSHQYDPNSTSNSYPTLSDSQQSPGPMDVLQPSVRSSRDYDGLRMQCEYAINELQSMKQQHADAVNRYGQVAMEAEYHRKRCKSSQTKQTQLTNELQSLKSENLEIVNERKKLEEQVINLQKLRKEDRQEISDLWNQHRKFVNERVSNNEIDEICSTVMTKFEEMKTEYEALRERYDELALTHTSVVSQLEFLTEEKRRSQKQMEELCVARDSAMMERNGLQHQCTSVIQNWNERLLECNQLKDKLTRITQQRDKWIVDYNQAVQKQFSIKKENEAMQKEKDEAVKNYALVLSERDTVHNEIEQLQEKLNSALKRIEMFEQEKKDIENERETLRREISSALQDRDKYKRERNEVSGMKLEVEQQRNEFHKEYLLMSQERDIARKERHEALDHIDRIIKDTYEKTQKEKAEEIDHVTKETDSLKNQIEKLRQDLSDALQEAEIAKKRRDWAFGERDKIVQERESIRSLCDNLRRDRDRAVSDLAQALRDSDDTKKQKIEACKELKEIKEKYEALAERESRKTQLNSIGHNHSRDSAIDADLQEWESETLDIELEPFEGAGYGFDIIGGRDDPQFQNDPSIYVCHVAKAGPADGKLRVNDLVLKLNNLDVTNVDRRSAKQAIRKQGTLIMVVRRRKSTSARIWHPLQITLSCQKDPGISIEQGLFIARISPGGMIAKDGIMLSVGDRIVKINGKPTDGMSAYEAMKTLEKSNNPIHLDIWRQASPMNSAGSSPTPTNQSSMSPLSDQPRVLSGMSKSDTIPQRAAMWDTSMDSSNGGVAGSNKNLRSHGSQTDSLDSPGPSPRKGGGRHPVHHDMEKARHSVHVLDRAIEKVEKIFRPRPKSQERNLEYCLTPVLKSGSKTNNSCASRTALSNEKTENVIAEFDAVLKRDDHSKESRSSKGRKRELEQESNSGTWPKSRNQQLTTFSGPATVIMRPSQHRIKERPSIKSSPFFDPPTNLFLRHDHDKSPQVKHISQNSDSSVKYNSSCSPPQNSVFVANAKESPLNIPVGVVKGTQQPRHSVSQFSHSQTSHGDQYQMHSPTSYVPPPLVTSSSSRAIEKSVKHRRPTSATHHKSDIHNRRSAFVLASSPSSHSSEKQQMLNFRPSSLQVPESINFMSPDNRFAFPLNLNENRMSSPSSSIGSNIGSRLSHHNHSISPQPQNMHSRSGHYLPPAGPNPYSPGCVSSQQVMSMPYSLPASVISDIDLERPPYSCVSDRYGSPSLSQHSSTTLSDEYIMYDRASPIGPCLFNTHIHSTLPKRGRDTERIRIPSSTSVSNKSGSVEIVSERSSPISPVFSERIGYLRSPLTEDGTSQYKWRKPLPGDTRTINIEKNAEPVGFKVENGPSGGIFVSSVNQNSLAAEAGLFPGDQLLEVCGINMRNATFDNALTVLRQCGDNLSMKVQFNPEKYREQHDTSSASSVSSMTVGSMSPMSPISPMSPDHSQPHYPMSSPRGSDAYSSQRSTDYRRCEMHRHVDSRDHHDTASSTSLASSKGHVTKSPSHSHSSSRGKSSSNDSTYERPRYVTLKKRNPNSSIGFSIVGGNAVGIFVHEAPQESLVEGANTIQRGDQILEYNSRDFRSFTAEQAAIELSKPCSVMQILAQFNLAKYNKIQTQPGDSFYIKCNFDRTAENEGELTFRRDDVLLVENTLHQGSMGSWYAWLVDDEGKKSRGGTIPNKIGLDDEVLRRSLSESMSLHDSDEIKPSSRRGSGSTRRSFFRRKRHQRNNSKDSHDLGSFSDASINSDSFPLPDDSIFGYSTVERIESSMVRPVLLLAPLSDSIINKLISESPDKYCSCPITVLNSSAHQMEQSVTEGCIIDYWKRDDQHECIYVSSIREVCDRKVHCLMNVGPSVIERLHRLKIYPIVIFVRHKSPKQIRDVRDVQFLPEKLTNKSAKESFEQHNKIESDYYHLFSVVIHGDNLAKMCMHIKTKIAAEQKKPIWIPVSRS
ncbi:disks large homolog 5-like [Gigantopelta aegis]|uniref:disks large homolog 5-like n=1 Tax=Gigantopelta aegis TaxID=1735272 RepID=UPI001B888845|nr:disks large homolog 5-like [Gigantopelta aegis]